MSLASVDSRPASWLPVSILCVLLSISPAATSQDQQASAAKESVSGTEAAAKPEIVLWLDSAPLNLVISQLAGISGRKPEIDRVPEIPVSGRFNGSLVDTLAMLSARYPVLFDVDDQTLSATGSEFMSKVSIVAANQDLDDAFKTRLLDGRIAGNSIEFRDDSVRVSGHPAFVGRTAMLIRETLADLGSRNRTDAAAETAQGQTDEEVIAPGTGTTGDTFVDAGSSELLADIRDEGKPPAEQAALSKPIRWVTDIPGFDTF